MGTMGAEKGSGINSPLIDGRSTGSYFLIMPRHVLNSGVGRQTLFHKEVDDAAFERDIPESFGADDTRK